MVEKYEEKLMEIRTIKALKTSENGWDIYPTFQTTEKTQCRKVEIIKGDGIVLLHDGENTQIIPKLNTQSMIIKIGADVITIIGVV